MSVYVYSSFFTEYTESEKIPNFVTWTEYERENNIFLIFSKYDLSEWRASRLLGKTGASLTNLGWAAQYKTLLKYLRLLLDICTCQKHFHVLIGNLKTSGHATTFIFKWLLCTQFEIWTGSPRDQDYKSFLKVFFYSILQICLSQGESFHKSAIKGLSNN